jgi:hypothetical protein
MLNKSKKGERIRENRLRKVKEMQHREEYRGEGGNRARRTTYRERGKKYHFWEGRRIYFPDPNIDTCTNV